MTFIDKTTFSKSDTTSWIFGAGASAGRPYIVPVQGALLGQFAKLKRPGNRAFSTTLDALKEEVAKICFEIQPGRAIDDPNLSLEEVFSSYELILSEPRSMPEERKQAEDAIRTLREAIRLTTMVYGRGDAKKWQPFNRGGKRSPYAQLLEQLFGSRGTGSHSFTTFNYDICLDRCAINLRHSKANIDVDYGIPLSNARHLRAPGFSPPRAGRSVLLLRTHGSLNWIRCRACASIFTTVDSHAKVRETTECWACGRMTLEYVLVHPSYLRTYADPIIQLVWGRCSEELVRSNRWIFVGYSLPPADVHFRALLRDALRVRRLRGQSTAVLLVGKGPTSEKDFNTVVETYRTMFTSNLEVWNATAGGFGDFVEVIAS